MSDQPGTTQKSVYANPTVAEWVEVTAENADRSESYIMNEVLHIIAEECGPPERFDAFRDALREAVADQ